MSLNRSRTGAVRGRIELILGPMYGGKSSELKRRMRRWKSAKKRCLVVNHSKDTRYNDAVGAAAGEHFLVTHDLEKIDAMPAASLADVDALVKGMLPAERYECIGIDEIHFFGMEAAEIMCRWRAAGIVVICAGLLAKATKELWPNILPILKEMDDLVFLPAICEECGEEDAAFTWALTNVSGAVQVGGPEEYLPVCSFCRHRLQEERDDLLAKEQDANKHGDQNTQ